MTAAIDYADAILADRPHPPAAAPTLPPSDWLVRNEIIGFLRDVMADERFEIHERLRAAETLARLTA